RHGRVTGAEGVPVAVTAADASEDALPRPGLTAHVLPRRRSEESHEVGEGDDALAVVVDPRQRIAREQAAVAAGTVLVRELGAGDAHLVQVRVAGKLVHRGHLVLPAEAADRVAIPGDVVDHRHPARLVGPERAL